MTSCLRNTEREAHDPAQSLLDPLPVISLSSAIYPHNAISPKMKSPRFPQEICDAIIDELASLRLFRPGCWNPIDVNCEELKRCALVCRGWRPRAQFWIFRYVSFVNRSLDGLRLFQAQLDLRPDCLSGVRGIHFCWGYGDSYPSRLVSTIAHSLVGQCPRIRYLSLIAYIFKFSATGPLTVHRCLPFHSRLHSALFRQSFRTITHLSLHRVRFHSDTDFFSFLSTFTSLETLSLDYIGTIKCEWIEQPEYVQLLKKKGFMDKLRGLRIVRGPFRASDTLS